MPLWAEADIRLLFDQLVGAANAAEPERNWNVRHGQKTGTE
jgi:hypothetical protein